MYSKTLFAGWADMDFNAHMKNTVFVDKSADVRGAMKSLPRTIDFVVLAPSVKGSAG